MATKTKQTRPSEMATVDAYMAKLKHPLADVAEALRKTILAADKSIGEEVKWNAPAFFYTGPMEPFDPKEYRRHLIVFNFFRKDGIRLVFWRGDRAQDKTGFLEGDYKDGRRLGTISSLEDLKAHKKTITAALKAQIKALK
jgi:hypothetical protein